MAQSAQNTARTNDISDQEWLDAVLNSVTNQGTSIGTIQLPGFPEKETQTITIQDGATENMLRGAFKLYSHVKAAAARNNSSLNANTRVLDFGCGWGRIARFFLREVDKKNLYGAEAVPALAQACNETFESDQFLTIDQQGTLPFEDKQFDLVFANSVFSHLTLELNLHWLTEIHRVLDSKGMAMLTIINEDTFTSMIDSHQADWLKKIGFDKEQTLNELSDGKFIWKSTNRQGNLEGYGFAAIPMSWIEANWSDKFRIVETISDYSQCVVVLEKR